MSKLFRPITLLAIVSLILAACAPAATVSPTQAPAATAAATAAPTQAPAATQAPTEAPAAEPKILRIRMHGDINNLDPAFWPSSTDEMVMDNIGQGLVEYKPGTWEVVNVLAESITPSADGLTIDFKLKEGIQFQKGYGEVTAEDVKFSYERFLDETLAAPYAGDWAPLDHVEVTGKYTGQIILKEPFAPLWTTTLPLGSGYVLSKKALEEKGAEAFGLDPIGTGPYEFVEWKPKEQITLKKFADFNPETIKDMGPATLEWDEIHLFPIVEDSAAAVALESGDVDFGYVQPLDFDRFQTNPDFTTVAVSGIDYEWLNVNIESPKLQDLRVRQAIRYALDIPAIIEAAHEGKWQRACAMVAPGQVGHWPDAPCYERDVERARQLLAEAGVSNLELNLTTNQSEPFQAGAQVVQAQLAEVGITVNIETVDDATYNDIGGHVKARDLTFVSYSTNPDPSWSTVWFLCDQVDQWNWTYYCNEELDALNAQAAKESDPQKRTDLYIQVQKIWDEAAVFNWIAYRSFFYVSRADLEMPIQPNGRWIAWAARTK